RRRAVLLERSVVSYGGGFRRTADSRRLAGAAASCPAQVTKEVTAQMLFGLVLCSARPGTRVASRRGQLPCVFPPSVCNVLTTAERCRGSGHCGKNLASRGVSRPPV